MTPDSQILLNKPGFYWLQLRVGVAAIWLALGAPLHASPGSAMPDFAELCSPPAAGADPQSTSTMAAPYRPPNDWAWLCFYEADNQVLRKGMPPDIIFMGDSITQAWITIDPAFFDASRIDRGISGQTSAQLLLRFQQDALSLRPKVIHLLVGTNDVAGNVGAMGMESYKSNIVAMADLAKANNIVLVLGAIPPADRFPWRASVEPVDYIRSLNRWLRDFSKKRRIVFVDYYAAMANPSGAAREGLTRDGVHPNADGYRIMADLAEPALKKALARSRRKANSP